MFDFYIDTLHNQNHVALLNHKTHIMEDVFLDFPKGYAVNSPKWGAIYYARVERIDIGLNSAFIDLGNGMKGILQAKHIHVSGAVRSRLPSQNKKYRISELLEAGSWLFVQVKAEGYAESEELLQKLPRLTTKIYIGGRTLLYSPNIIGIYSTHWISKEEEETVGKKLLEEHEKGGWVIRQMAADISDEILDLEADSLIAMWQRAKERARNARDAKTPICVMRAPDAIERSLIDYARRGINHFEVMTKDQANIAKEWASRFAPDLLQKITVAKFSHNDKVKSLFDAHDILSMIEALNEKVVELPSGGNIVIERTQACTVVDINSGSADKFQTNLEAAVEIMRQIRLRNISGIIICDMINENSKNNRNQIMSIFQKSGETDPADPQMHGFTRLMMAEITRRRRSSSLYKKCELDIKDKFAET